MCNVFGPLYTVLVQSSDKCLCMKKISYVTNKGQFSIIQYRIRKKLTAGYSSTRYSLYYICCQHPDKVEFTHNSIVCGSPDRGL